MISCNVMYCSEQKKYNITSCFLCEKRTHLAHATHNSQQIMQSCTVRVRQQKCKAINYSNMLQITPQNLQIVPRPIFVLTVKEADPPPNIYIYIERERVCFILLPATRHPFGTAARHRSRGGNGAAAQPSLLKLHGQLVEEAHQVMYPSISREELQQRPPHRISEGGVWSFGLHGLGWLETKRT